MTYDCFRRMISCKGISFKHGLNRKGVQCIYYLRRKLFCTKQKPTCEKYVFKCFNKCDKKFLYFSVNYLHHKNYLEKNLYMYFSQVCQFVSIY